jgi:hypothetical protein
MISSRGKYCYWKSPIDFAQKGAYCPLMDINWYNETNSQQSTLIFPNILISWWRLNWQHDLCIRFQLKPKKVRWSDKILARMQLRMMNILESSNVVKCYPRQLGMLGDICATEWRTQDWGIFLLPMQYARCKHSTSIRLSSTLSRYFWYLVPWFSFVLPCQWFRTFSNTFLTMSLVPSGISPMLIYLVLY